MESSLPITATEATSLRQRLLEAKIRALTHLVSSPEVAEVLKLSDQQQQETRRICSAEPAVAFRRESTAKRKGDTLGAAICRGPRGARPAAAASVPFWRL